MIPAVTTSMSPQIRSEPWACLRRRTGAPPAGAFVSITAGTNFGAVLSTPGFANARACRRQVKTCCGVGPRRRATSETTAPATSVSATTSLLKSSENCRRRPIPVTTSSRRTSVASGLSVWSSVDISRSPSRDQQNRPSRPSTEGGVTTALTHDQHTQHHYSSGGRSFRMRGPTLPISRTFARSRWNSVDRRLRAAGLFFRRHLWLTLDQLGARSVLPKHRYRHLFSVRHYQFSDIARCREFRRRYQGESVAKLSLRRR